MMAATNSIFECRRLADAVVAAGGEIPSTLGYLLANADLIDAHSAPAAPLTALVDQLVGGKLDSAKLTKLVAAAVQEKAIADLSGDLKIAVEPALVTRFHAELAAGGADLVLDSLRGQFDKAAGAIAHAKSAIGSGESTPEHVLDSGGPETVAAWQQLPQHLATVGRISAIAAMFGCRQGAQFPQVKEFALADNFRVSDVALACTTGPLAIDSSLFMQPDHGRTSSPFYRCGGLKLHTVEEMQERYNGFAASEFDRIHGGPRGGYIGEDGRVHEDPVPTNPSAPVEVSA